MLKKFLRYSLLSLIAVTSAHGFQVEVELDHEPVYKSGVRTRGMSGGHVHVHLELKEDYGYGELPFSRVRANPDVPIVSVTTTLDELGKLSKVPHSSISLTMAPWTNGDASREAFVSANYAVPADLVEAISNLPSRENVVIRLHPESGYYRAPGELNPVLKNFSMENRWSIGSDKDSHGGAHA